MFTQSSSLGLQIAFRFGVAPPPCSELFPAPAQSSLSSSADASIASFCLPTPSSRDLGTAGTPHRTDRDYRRVGWSLHPKLEGRGSAAFGRHPPRSRWSEVLRKATPGMRDQSAPRVFADHEWVQSSASPASAGAAGSGWSSRVLSPSATGLRTALGTDTGGPPGQPCFFHSKDSGWGRYPAKLFSVPISKPGRQRRRLSSDKRGSRHPFQRR